MARITVEDCLKNVDSAFSLVLSASHRGRQLLSGEVATLNQAGQLRPDKETVLALREIAEKTVTEADLTESLISNLQLVRPPRARMSEGVLHSERYRSVNADGTFRTAGESAARGSSHEQIEGLFTTLGERLYDDETEPVD